MTFSRKASRLLLAEALMLALFGSVIGVHAQTNSAATGNPVTQIRGLLDRCASTPEGLSRFIIIPTTPIPQNRHLSSSASFTPTIREGSVLQDSGFTSYVIAMSSGEILRALEHGQLKVLSSRYKVYAADTDNYSVLVDRMGTGLFTFDAKLGDRKSMRVAFRGGTDVFERVIWRAQPVWPVPVGARSCSIWALVVIPKAN